MEKDITTTSCQKKSAHNYKAYLANQFAKRYFASVREHLQTKQTYMYSMTYTGILTFVVGYIFTGAGVPFVSADIEKFVSVGVTLLGVLLSLWGRYRAGGIDIFGIKK